MLELLQTLKLDLLHAGYADLDHNWDYDNVISPFSRLFLVTSGSARVYHSNCTFQLKPGYMYLIPSFVYNRYKCDDFHSQYYISFFDEIETGLSIYNLRDFIYEREATQMDRVLFERLSDIYPERRVVNSDPKAYVHQPSALVSFNGRDARLRTNRYLETQGTLHLLLSRFIKSSYSGETTMDVKNSMNKTLIYISKHLHQSLTIQGLAKLNHVSPDHFSRVFLKKTGMRPNAYIQQKRIQRAQLLLMTTDDSLAQIAVKVGMENYSYFSRTFKKILGKSPRKFRKESLPV